MWEKNSEAIAVKAGTASLFIADGDIMKSSVQLICLRMCGVYKWKILLSLLIRL